MTNEAANSKLVKEDILAERQGLMHQIGTALPQGIVEAFDVGGLPSLLANGTMPFSG